MRWLCDVGTDGATVPQQWSCQHRAQSFYSAWLAVVRYCLMPAKLYYCHVLVLRKYCHVFARAAKQSTLQITAYYRDVAHGLLRPTASQRRVPVDCYLATASQRRVSVDCHVATLPVETLLISDIVAQWS